MMKLDIGMVSAVVVLGDGVEDLKPLWQVDAILARLVPSHELVIIANGVSETVSRCLIKEVEELPDSTVYFLSTPVDHDMASTIGMDNAVGDWILFIAPEDVDRERLYPLLSAATERYEHVLLEAAPRAGGGPYDLLQRLFFAAYRLLTGLPVECGASRTRLYSRAAALYVLSSRQREMLLHSARLAGGFATKVIPRTEGDARTITHRPFDQALKKAVGIFLHSTTLPLRAIVMLAIASGMLNLAYATYVLLTYVFVEKVAPGWATLSLQNAGMFFIFSILFALFGEYLMQIEMAMSSRLRYSVAREVKGRRTRLLDQRNVIEAV